MLGDSYMDKNFGNVGANIIAAAQQAGRFRPRRTIASTTWLRRAMNNGAGQLNIPYQYDTMAKGDLAVTNPKDIKVVIMDGGGNDAADRPAELPHRQDAGDPDGRHGAH